MKPGVSATVTAKDVRALQDIAKNLPFRKLGFRPDSSP
jgi:hypothetical protein